MLEINASGVILKERSWQFTSSGTQMAGSGLGEEYIYKTVLQYFQDEDSITIATCPELDKHGTPTSNPTQDCSNSDLPTPAQARELLLVEHRSVGWSATEAQANQYQGSPSDGLVHFYRYKLFDVGANPKVPWGSRVQLVGEGVQKGAKLATAGPQFRLYTHQIFRTDSDPNQVLSEAEFTEPRTDLLTTAPTYPPTGAPPAGMRVTHHREEHGDSGNPERVTSRLVVHAPRQQQPNGYWYYPIEREVYGADGGTQWSVTGLVKNIASPTGSNEDEHSSLLFTYYQRDGSGRSTATVMDVNTADAGHTVVHQGQPDVPVPAFPTTGWWRLPSDSSLPHNGALEYVTAFQYDDYGPTDIYFPGGKRFARRWVAHKPDPTDASQDWTEEFTFNNLIWHDTTGGVDHFTTQSPGERKEYL